MYHSLAPPTHTVDSGDSTYLHLKWKMDGFVVMLAWLCVLGMQCDSIQLLYR